MKAWQVEWRIPFDPSNDYLMPVECDGRALFATPEVAGDFAAKLRAHGWKDSHGFRNRAVVSVPKPIEHTDSADVLTTIPSWCFPAELARAL